ncbi:MAG: hypothetical protein PUD03_02900 [Lachnospiraceae bacterium]|nr:hypothetical protein [Lachnospiraceae bacterium]MDD5853035.1 hypothetical protein [Lachnospiraceae bacterium]
MKKKAVFLIKCLVMLALIVLFCFVIVMPQYLLNYQASLIDKNERLCSIDEAKIVLVGNSNWAFGVDSQKLEEAMGMPVVNMGMHGGIGNPFNEQAAVQNIYEGDIVIISYSNFADGDIIKNPELAWITIENHPALWKYIRLKDWPSMIKAYPTYLKDCLDLWSQGIGNMDSGTEYSRLQFNEYGDNIYDRPALVISDEELAEAHIPEIGDETIDRLNKLNQTLQEKGATLLVTPYPTPVTSYTPPVEEYVAFSDQIEERLDFPLIGRYEDYRMDKNLFYNTYLHLNNEGKQLRTQMLIDDLQEYLSSK